jgi:hypothetical protein
MKVKIENKEYGTGAGAFKKLYEDFLLLVSALNNSVLWDYADRVPSLSCILLQHPV